MYAHTHTCQLYFHCFLQVSINKHKSTQCDLLQWPSSQWLGIHKSLGHVGIATGLWTKEAQKAESGGVEEANASWHGPEKDRENGRRQGDNGSVSQ